MSTRRQSLLVDIGKLASDVTSKWPRLAALDSAALDLPRKLIYEDVVRHLKTACLAEQDSSPLEVQ